MDRKTADRIVLSRYTLGKYKAMGLPEFNADLLRIFSDEVDILRKLRAEHDLQAVDDLIDDWEMLRDRLKAMQH